MLNLVTMELIDYNIACGKIETMIRDIVPGTVVSIDWEYGLRKYSASSSLRDLVLEFLFQRVDVDFSMEEFYEDGAQEMLGMAALYVRIAQGRLRGVVVAQDSPAGSQDTVEYAPGPR